MIEPEPCVDHPRDRVLAAEEDAADVDGHDLVPGRDVGVDDRVVGLRHDPGVVVQDVDAAVDLGRVLDHPRGRCLVGHVGLDEARLAARLPDESNGLLARFLVELGDDDLRRPRRRTIWDATRPMPPPAPVMIATLSWRRTRPPSSDPLRFANGTRAGSAVETPLLRFASGAVRTERYLAGARDRPPIGGETHG